MKKWIALMFSVICAVNLCACGDDSKTTATGVPPSSEEIAAWDEPTPEDEIYTGMEDSPWCSALFEDSSVVYKNDLAIVAAQMSDMAEDTTGEGIKKLYSDYGLYACEVYNYTSGLVLGGLEVTGGGGAFAIGQDTLNINGVDTTILVITARGTTTWGETFGDLWKGWYLDVNKTHSFLERNVWDNVFDFEELILEGVQKYSEAYPAIAMQENLKILITGHSLGGAAANLFGARCTWGYMDGAEWLERDQEDIYVYTFGAIKVLTSEQNESYGYENIHNIYNYYDSYGPNGNQKNTNASSLNAKFGHTELYYLQSEESGNNVWDSCNSHLMSNYREALRLEKEQGNVLELTCPEDGWWSYEGDGEEGDFYIEGSWESVGSYGFGQAQPGAVVTFDGEHCNFFSPYDTYSFYWKDGQWTLECTSFIFAQTLSFAVEVIDEDTINVYFDSACTNLRRVD